ncbi:Dimer-Tnp-hAT domain-containing protein, partial [Pyrenophora tritici-repentis]
MPRAGLKRPRAAPSTANKRAKGASRGAGSESQPVLIDDSQQALPLRVSPRKALAATQAEAAETFEAEIRESQAIVAPTEGSKAATVASAEDNDASDEGFDERFVDDFEGIDWSRLPRFQKPLRTLKQKKSWRFRLAAIIWLVENNHPITQFEQPAFRAMLTFANPEAEAALWRSHHSVSRFVLRLYDYMVPQVVQELSTAASKIHISFDGWTTKGGKRGFFGVVAHYATATGDVRDVAIDLPHLAGVHSGERIASCINQVLMKFGITSTTLGYFVLDNAYTNDAAVAKLSAMYNFSARQRRLRCAPHTLNLVGQSLIFGSNPDSYDNAFAEHNDEEHFMHEWREQGPLGVLLSIIKYIKTPQQYTLFETFQAHANAELPADERQKILEPVKPVATRWNSFCSAFERAALLQHAVNAYANHHIDATRTADSYARTHNNKMSDAPTWMRSDGLSASDWQVITEYIGVLRPLKEATLRLEGRGKAGRFGAIYEVIPVFEYLLNEYEARVKSYEHVDYEAANAPEDHLAINLRAAWAKLNEYYSKLDDSVVYYAAVTLHPYYKRYCERSWRDKSDWLRSSKQNFQQLWATYKPVATSPKHRKARLPNAIDDAIAALADDDSSDNELMDEYELWSRLEPKWTSQQFATNGHPIRYWLSLRSKYPHLHRFAIDVLTIPASSCECERMFSELGDLLEPRRRKIGA